MLQFKMQLGLIFLGVICILKSITLPSERARAGAYTATAVYNIICSMYKALA